MDPLHLVLGATSHIQKHKDWGSCYSRVFTLNNRVHSDNIGTAPTLYVHILVIGGSTKVLLASSFPFLPLAQSMDDTQTHFGPMLCWAGSGLLIMGSCPSQAQNLNNMTQSVYV